MSSLWTTFSRPDILQRYIHAKHSIVTIGGLSKQPEIKLHHVALQDKNYEQFKLLHLFTCMVAGMTGSGNLFGCRSSWSMRSRPFNRHHKELCGAIPTCNQHTLIYCNPFRRLNLFVVFHQIWRRNGISTQTSKSICH